MLKHSLTTLLVTLASVACTNERTPTSPPACLDYDVDIQPVLERACLECHGLEPVENDYSVATPAHTFARRADGVARVEANSEALLLSAIRGANDHPVAEPDDLALFERWLIDCQANTLRTEASHPRGWLDDTSEDFHGAALRESSWDFGACSECHGKLNDEDGGPSGIGCTTCHTDSPVSCGTCHGVAASDGAPGPALDGSTETTARGVGAHRLHTSGRLLSAQVQCEDCHVVPEEWDDPGHILTAGGGHDEAPAEVVFGAAASRSLEGAEQRRTAEPSYDAATGTCNNIYCHAAVVGDSDVQAPVWTEIDDEPECDTCHGFPPDDTHADSIVPADCANCHPLLIGTQTGPSSFELLDQSLHIDGRLALGNGNERCSACHGSHLNSAPPTAVGGVSESSNPRVGAHQAHVAIGAFRGPIGCGECHPTPSGDTFLDAVGAVDHIDTALPAEVFGSHTGTVASASGATPTYSGTSCTNTYCHGGGTLHATDTATGIVRTLDWTDVGNGTVTCGSCHGVPPLTPTHWQTMGPGVPMTRIHCGFCHRETSDADGNIIFAPDGSTTHMDGELNR